MTRRISKGHIGRYREIASILAEEGLGALAVGLGLPEAFHSKRIQAPDATTPERARRSLERLGPAAVKLGQMLSTRPDLVPENYRIELRRLQDSVAPIPSDVVASVIEAELGAAPDELFARFDTTPVASASIGQVHSARLKEGWEVVVKVQRPGILTVVETDLDIMRTQARRLAGSHLLPPAIDVVAIADELAEALRKELDYLHEASNIERFRRAFADDEAVVIPRVHHEYSSRRLLTMERLEGIPFNRLDLVDEARLDRHDLAVRGIRAYLRQIFGMGMFHADPHPGNIFALPGDRIGFTDFGRVGDVSAGVGDTVSDLLLGMVDRDADLVTDALMDVSGDPTRIDIERLRREMSVLIGKYHGAELGQFHVGEVLEDMLDVFRTHQLGLPSDMVMLLATMAVLEGVGRDLDPGFDFIDAARPYADRLARQQFQLDELARKTARTARRWMRTATELPSSVERALRRIAEGEVRVAIRPQGYERMLDRAEEMFDRLAFAVLVAAFVIGFSTLLRIEGLPRWLQVVLVSGMMGALGVSAWIFASLLLARWRSRGPD